MLWLSLLCVSLSVAVGTPCQSNLCHICTPDRHCCNSTWSCVYDQVFGYDICLPPYKWICTPQPPEHSPHERSSPINISHVHVSLGDTDESMRIGYSTDKVLWPANWSSACLYGPDLDVHGTVAKEPFVRSYDPSAWKSGTHLRWDLRFVQLHGLSPGTRYYYRCGVVEPATGQLHLAADVLEFTFRSLSESWSFVAFGDLGVEDGNEAEGKVAVGYTRRRIQDEVLNHSASLVLHYGDISYARGTDSTWDAFFDAVEPVASRVPWMTSPGNHEIQAPDSGNEKGVPYFAR